MTWSELHCHSAHSLLDGTGHPEALTARAALLGYPALALTDHDSLGGLVNHARACADAGITPIAGVELSLQDGSHLTLLARDALGYRSLCRLVSRAQLAGEKGAPCARYQDLAADSAGLECLTGCRRGQVAAAVARQDLSAANAALAALVAIFGRAHTWVEVQRAGLADDRVLSYHLAQLAQQAEVGLVATGNSHYAEAHDRDLHDVLVCIKQRVPLQRARPYLRPGASWHLRAPQEMADRFADLPAALRGAEELAARCRFDLAYVEAMMPPFPVPAGHSSESYLRALTEQGLPARYGDGGGSVAVQERLSHELSVISALHMADYFLIVWDLVCYARAQGMLCQGRGSSVGSLVCYALGITAVEPLAHRLSFERFLALGRTDPPDIDLDLPSDRDDGRPARDAVIQYALTHYPGHAALVSTAITFRARSALREVGMALGLDRAAQDALAATQDHGGRAVRTPHLPPTGRAAHLTELCARLEGLPRHLGQHPGGIVLSARPLAEVAPIEHARMAGRIVVQWDKDAAELAGLAKIDLLGLGMLAVIQTCFAMLTEQTGEQLQLHGFRCDDPRVFDAFCRSDTVGVFQLESRAQMAACLPLLQPRTLDDLAVAVALIRPGPIQGGVVQPYLRRRQHQEPITYPGGDAGRRLLEPVLGDTLGVVLFQDQVIELGRACGLSPDEAAELRRAMSSARSSARMARLRDRLVEGLAAQGIPPAAREQIVATMQAFSGYGFVRGHAHAFGYLAYVSCWLKIYHPAIFAGALLDAQPMGFYPNDLVLQDAERHGVRVRPVDIFASGEQCMVERDGALRLGLRQIQQLSHAAAARVAAVMAQRPVPASLEELCTRALLDIEDAMALARGGALRGLIADRRQALWQAPVIARAARADWLPRVVALADPPVCLVPATPDEELRLDLRTLGLSPGRHVLDHLRARLTALGVTTAAALSGLPPGTPVCIASQQVATQRPPTARGVTFASLSDETGMINLVIMPAIYERDRAIIRGEVLVWVEGVIEWRTGSVAVRARSIRPLGEMLP